MAAPTNAMLTAAGTRLAICAHLDILDDPLWHALSPVSITAPITSILPVPDAAFDGRTFTALDPRFVRVTPVAHGAGGAEAVSFTVAGSLDMDSALMTALSNPARFRGRSARLWIVHLNDAWAPDAARAIYSGKMTVPQFSMGADEQVITITAENYLSILASGAPSRTLLSQKTYDADDMSSEATLSTASSGAALGPNVLAGAARDVFNPNIQWL